VPFDYGANDLCAGPSSGLYTFGGGTIAYGGASYTSQFTSLEVNAPDGNCIGAPSGATLRLINFAGAPFASATLDLLGPGLGSDAIPTSPVPAAGFSVNYVGHGFGGIAGATGPISQVTPVPEPASSILFLSGLAYAAVRRRRQPSV
jgi:hypothetical protein